MNPTYSIITNIEVDHLENHGSLENIIKSFSKFIDQTSKEVFICSDCEILRGLAATKENKNIIRYSIKDKSADIYADNIEIGNGKTSYDVIIKRRKNRKIYTIYSRKSQYLNLTTSYIFSFRIWIKREGYRESF